MPTTHLRRLAVLISAVAVSVGAFAILLLFAAPPWRSREYIAIAVWSIPLACLTLPATRLQRYLRRRWGVAAAVGAVPILALACALAWTICVYALTGPMILGTFDANPFWSWTFGSLGGLVVSLIWPAGDSAPRRRPAP